MSNKTAQQTSEKLLGLIRNGGNGQARRLFRIIANPDRDGGSVEPGKGNERYCEVLPFDQMLSKAKPQLDAIWSNILLTQGTTPRSVLLTSATTGEGVSYVSERLCLYLSRTYGHKILYVNIADQMALPDAPAAPSPEETVARLTSAQDLGSLILSSNVPGLSVLSLNISEGQHALPWLQPELNAMGTLLAYAREHFDVTILDAQSVLMAPWTASMAKSVDVTLLVCRFAVTRREVLNTLLEAFRAANVTPRGVILNARRYSVPQALYRLLK